MLGITELVERAKGNISRGILAYGALQKVRAAGTAGVPADVTKTLEENGNLLGYALLLKPYLDDPTQATPAQIEKAAWDTGSQVAPLFWTFRIMVACGFYFIAFFAVFFYLSARRMLTRWPLLLRPRRALHPAAVDRGGMRVVRGGVRPPALDHRGHPAHALPSPALAR